VRRRNPAALSGYIGVTDPGNPTNMQIHNALGGQITLSGGTVQTNSYFQVANGIGISGSAYSTVVIDAGTAPTAGGHLTNKTYVDSRTGLYWHGGYTGSLAVSNAVVTTVPIVLTGTNSSTHSWVVSGGLVTLPVAGFYVLTANAAFNLPPWAAVATPKRAFLQLTVNGTGRHGRNNFGPTEDICQTAWSAWFAAGTQILFTVFQDSGAAKTLLSCEVGISGIPQ